jgi:hypothetical protein
MIRLQPDIIVTRLSTTIVVSSSRSITKLDGVTGTSFQPQVAETSKSNSNDLVTQHYSYWSTSSSWLKLLFGSLAYHRQNSQRRGRNRQLLHARYTFPELFTTRVWEVAGCRSMPDWSVNFRTYRIIPDDAPILEAIKRGDILRVQSLLASKAAFVTDRDDLGTGLLHVSLSSTFGISSA